MREAEGSSLVAKCVLSIIKGLGLIPSTTPGKMYS